MNHIEELPAPGLGRRILLVDDDPVQLKLARVQLEYAGFVVHPAEGAYAAEAMLQRGLVPDAIVSDVVMDGVDGFDLCRRLREIGELAHIPVILMSSAFDEEEDRILARKLGANALVRRSPSQQACVEALVLALAEGASSASVSVRPDLYAARIGHQLVRLSRSRSVAEARYAMLFEHANDAIAFITKDGVFLDVNAKWEEICGLPREDLRGRHLRDFAASEHETPSETTRGRTVPAAIRRGDGTTIYLEFTTATVDIEGSPVILSIGRDVTSLVEATRKLEASERHYRSLVENAPDIIWSATIDWKFTFLSPNIERITGFSAEDIMTGKHGAALARVHPDDLGRVQAAREAMSTQGTPMDVECRWQRRDDQWIWVHLRGVRTATGIDGTFSDVTARKALEEQLLQSQKIEELGRLTANVAHDFNNILAIVLLNATQLVRTLPAGDAAGDMARELLDAGERGVALTRQLLAFSRRQACAPKNIDLNGLINGMSRLLERTVGARIEIERNLSDPLGRVHADSAQLEQVLMNLVVNARDAMNGVGKLRIATTNLANQVRLSITDTGCGMDAATVQRAFEPFFTTKAAGQGTGLGLASCAAIMRSVGGQISVDSTVDHGTTFHLDFPRVKETTSYLPLRMSAQVERGSIRATS